VGAMRAPPRRIDAERGEQAARLRGAGRRMIG
jgi:hypothetical protein